jgi:hypothetical protein
MSFIVQISPIVHLFTLKIVFRWGAKPPEPPQQGSALALLGAFSGPQTPRRKMCLHFISCIAVPLGFFFKSENVIAMLPQIVLISSKQHIYFLNDTRIKFKHSLFKSRIKINIYKVN